MYIYIYIFLSNPESVSNSEGSINNEFSIHWHWQSVPQCVRENDVCSYKDNLMDTINVANMQRKIKMIKSFFIP